MSVLNLLLNILDCIVRIQFQLVQKINRNNNLLPIIIRMDKKCNKICLKLIKHWRKYKNKEKDRKIKTVIHLFLLKEEKKKLCRL